MLVYLIYLLIALIIIVILLKFLFNVLLLAPVGIHDEPMIQIVQSLVSQTRT